MNKRKAVFVTIAIAIAIVGIGLTLHFITGKSQRTLTAAEHLVLGERYLLDFNYEQALVHFMALIEVEPMNPRGYTGAAEAHIGLGDIESATALLRQGLEQLPGNVDIIEMLNELTRPADDGEIPLAHSDITLELDLVGDSTFDAEDNSILLVPAVDWSSGNAFFRSHLSDNFNVTFDYKIGGGTGADGIVFAFFTLDEIPAVVGGQLSFDGSDGYGVEFDSYFNQEYGDSPNPHIALIHNEVSNHLVSVDDERVRTNQWHTADIKVVGDRIIAAIDGDTIIDYTGNIDRTNRCMFFAASTGASNDNHYIRSVVLTELP